MSLASAHELLNSTEYTNRLEAQMLIEARVIQKESPSTTLHAKRKQIADAVLYTQGTYPQILAVTARMVIAENSTIRNTTLPLSDAAQFESDIEYVLSHTTTGGPDGLLFDEDFLDALLVL